MNWKTFFKELIGFTICMAYLLFILIIVNL